MRVVVFIRSDALTVHGGPTEQARRYVAHLQERGVDALLWPSHEPPPGRFDVAHLLNLDWPVETAHQFRLARACADRVVLSTIHHREMWVRDQHRAGRAGIAAVLSRRLSLERFEGARGAWLARTAPRLWPEAGRQGLTGPRRRQRDLLRDVDLCLTHGPGEMQSLAEDFGVSPPTRHLANGYAEAPDDEPPAGLPSEFLLCVGRVEARKNQAALLDAAEHLDLPVVLVGAPNPNHRRIAAEVRRRVERSSRFVWFEHLDRGATLATFRAATAHVLPSWVEVLPIVDFEAAAGGARIVTTARGYTHEYLGDAAHYWDPTSGAHALARMIERALAAPAPPLETARYWSWDRVGEALHDVYRTLLDTT